MKEVIYDFLIEEGIPPNIIGFHHIMNVIEILENDKQWKFCGDNGVFERVAEEENKDHGWRTIERLCRHAKSKARRYREMTLKEWLCWATLQCADEERSKNDSIRC